MIVFFRLKPTEILLDPSKAPAWDDPQIPPGFAGDFFPLGPPYCREAMWKQSRIASMKNNALQYTIRY